MAQKREPQPQRREAASQRTHQQRGKRRGRGNSNRGLWLTLGGVLIAVAGIVVLFLVLGRQPSNPGGAYPSTAADPTVIKQITSVDPAVLAQVGAGSGKVLAKPARQTGTSLLTGPTGKPEVFYYGAEFCPYCATDRWPLIVALSRFGTFRNLRQIASSSDER